MFDMKKYIWKQWVWFRWQLILAFRKVLHLFGYNMYFTGLDRENHTIDGFVIEKLSDED